MKNRHSLTIDLPNADLAAAEDLVRYAKVSGICPLASLIDSQHFMTLHLDRATAENVADALRASDAEGNAPLLFMINEWIAQTNQT